MRSWVKKFLVILAAVVAGGAVSAGVTHAIENRDNTEPSTNVEENVEVDIEG